MHALAAHSSQTFRDTLLSAIFGERRLVVRVILLTLFGALLALAPPQISRMAIDEALPKSAPRLLVVLSSVALLVGLHEAWAGWIEDSATTLLQARTERRALQHLMHASLHSDASIAQTRSAGWMSETVGGAGSIVEAYVGSLSSLLTQGCFALAYLGLLLVTSPAAALVVGAVSGLIALASWSLIAWETRTFRSALDASSTQQELLHGLLSSLSALRGLYCSNRMGRNWSDALRQATSAGISHARASAVRGLVVSVGSRALNLGVLLWVVYRCLQNKSGVGEMILLTAVVGGFSSAVLGFSGALIGLRGLGPQFERVDEVLANVAPEVETLAHPRSQEISVHDVSHRYSDDSRWVLTHRSLTIQRGEIRHLQSPSGSGKSTLLRLMAGLMPPSKGRVQIFGVNATEARNLVLYVPQHCSLFEASILENLRLLSGADDEMIERVAQLTGLDELLNSLPMGLDTPVAAEGQNLSSGQRQLIVLTGAFSSNRPVLLLDEATSQIDSATRKRIAWQQLLQRRTAVIVDHHTEGNADGWNASN